MLGKVEQFYLEMITIPNYTQRLRCAILEEKFGDAVLNIETQVELLESATKEVEDSISFRKILEIVLSMGNYLNGGTPRGHSALSMASLFSIDVSQVVAMVSNWTVSSNFLLSSRMTANAPSCIIWLTTPCRQILGMNTNEGQFLRRSPSSSRKLSK